MHCREEIIFCNRFPSIFFLFSKFAIDDNDIDDVCVVSGEARGGGGHRRGRGRPLQLHAQPLAARGQAGPHTVVQGQGKPPHIQVRRGSRDGCFQFSPFPAFSLDKFNQSIDLLAPSSRTQKRQIILSAIPF